VSATVRLALSLKNDGQEAYRLAGLLFLKSW
jgi:hypothetical protein